MRAIYTIAEREFRALIVSPLGYVVMMFFLLLSGFFFMAPLQANIATIRYWLGNVTILLVFLLPAVTMRLIAEEKKQGTIELLMTSPVTEAQVTLGKYLGVLAYYGVILFSTLQYVFVLAVIRKSDANPVFPTYTGLVLIVVTLVAMVFAGLQESRVLAIVSAFLGIATIICAGFAARQMGEWGPVVSGYVGLFLLGATFLAIGLLTSALTRNQIIAWVATAAILLMLYLITWITGDGPPTAPELPANAGILDRLGHVLNWAFYGLHHIAQVLDVQRYLQTFAQGVLDLRDLVLYLSLIGMSLFFAVRALTTSRSY